MNKDSLSPLHKIVETTLRNEAKEIEDASRRVGPSVVETAEIILNHEGKVVICGLGKSGLIGQKIVATLCSTGIQAVFLHAAEALHGDLAETCGASEVQPLNYRRTLCQRGTWTC